ncbi:Altered inheritance of mitochondria protein 41 [Venturia nashicola]|nr:Altered inheritance of mitochondria protein 41 [Venturia nashicola]
MASRILNRLLLPSFSQSRPTVTRQCLQCRYSSTETTASPILAKLRDDLKGAMRTKDQARLSVLRSVLADITNLSKTASPVKDDLALLSLLRKRIGSAKGAVEEFMKANRADLVEKEQRQLDILDEYASGVKTMDVEDIRTAVKSAIETLKGAGGNVVLPEVLRSAMASLEGQPVQKSEVVRLVKEELGMS